MASRLLLLPAARNAGFRFRGMSILVVSQLCIGNGETALRQMIGSGGKFPVKPERADVRRVLIPHAMRHESVIRDRHKIFSGCAFQSSDCEGIFTHESLVCEPDVLQDHWIAHRAPIPERK